MDNSTAFQMYQNYAETIREKAANRGARPRSSVLCENDFVRVWQSLPTTERIRWEERFKAGFERIILNESSRYVSVLGNNESACLKAA